MLLKEICQLIKGLIDLSPSKDNLDTLFVEGEISEVITPILIRLFEVLKPLNNPRIIKLIRIDCVEIDINDIALELRGLPASWDLTINKQELLIAFGYDTKITTYREMLFFSTEFLINESNNLIGTADPFKPGSLNKEPRVRIQALGLKNKAGSDHLLITPIGETSFPEEEQANTQSKFLLPNERKILESVVVLSPTLVILSPKSFQLSWGDLDNELFYRLRIAYLQSLLSCICTHFHSADSITIDGIKKFNVSISSHNYLESTKAQINQVEKVISWIYLDEDFETKRTLFCDRISLEIKSGFNLLKIETSVLESALTQAKSKYKYVIAERNDDYRKELRDLYSDMKKFTDSITEVCDILTKGLITDILSIGFIFTITMFARVTALKNEIISSTTVDNIFKAIAIYLLISFVLRFWNGKIAIKQSENVFDEWSRKLHNHISTEEVLDMKNKLTKEPKMHFESVHAVVGALYAILAFIAYHYKMFIN